jgi:rare lipoprotein A (RlpA)-like double-psi beta-barrel protein
VSPSLVQRLVWLAGITLVVGIGALALQRRDAGGGRGDIPGSVPVPGTLTGYYMSRAAPYGPTPRHRRTACGEAFTKTLQGVAHPVLPCGVKIYIRFNGKDVLTQVVDRGPNVPGRDFDITKALADRMGLHGTQKIEWRYAR